MVNFGVNFGELLETFLYFRTLSSTFDYFQKLWLTFPHLQFVLITVSLEKDFRGKDLKVRVQCEKKTRQIKLPVVQGV